RRVKISFAMDKTGFVRRRRARASGIPEHRQDGDALQRLGWRAHRDFGESGHNLRRANDDAEAILAGLALKKNVGTAHVRLCRKATRAEQKGEAGSHRLSRSK